MRTGSGVLYAALLLLLLLNAGIFLLLDRPLQANRLSLGIPYELGDAAWLGIDDELTHKERQVLAPAELTSRIYRPVVGGAASTDPWDWIWLDVLRSDSVGALHNFYDSMIASGGRPQVLGERILQTGRGPMRMLVLRNQGTTGKTFYMLLWYQWQGGTAPSRWQWYWEVLKLRASGRQTSWLLVKLATPVQEPDGHFAESEELKKLERFARLFYESVHYRRQD